MLQSEALQSKMRPRAQSSSTNTTRYSSPVSTMTNTTKVSAKYNFMEDTIAEKPGSLSKMAVNGSQNSSAGKQLFGRQFLPSSTPIATVIPADALKDRHQQYLNRQKWPGDQHDSGAPALQTPPDEKSMRSSIMPFQFRDFDRSHNNPQQRRFSITDSSATKKPVVKDGLLTPASGASSVKMTRSASAQHPATSDQEVSTQKRNTNTKRSRSQADAISKCASSITPSSANVTANGEDDIWSDEVEKAFEEAYIRYPNTGRTKMKGDDGKLYGRNELIAMYIEKKTGKTRTRKQISSHIQVLVKKVHRTGKENFTSNDQHAAAMGIGSRISANENFGDVEELHMLHMGPITNEDAAIGNAAASESLRNIQSKFNMHGSKISMETPAKGGKNDILADAFDKDILASACSSSRKRRKMKASPTSLILPTRILLPGYDRSASRTKVLDDDVFSAEFSMNDSISPMYLKTGNDFDEIEDDTDLDLPCTEYEQNSMKLQIQSKSMTAKTKYQRQSVKDNNIINIGAQLKSYSMDGARDKSSSIDKEREFQNSLALENVTPQTAKIRSAIRPASRPKLICLTTANRRSSSGGFGREYKESENNASKSSLSGDENDAEKASSPFLTAPISLEEYSAQRKEHEKDCKSFIDANLASGLDNQDMEQLNFAGGIFPVYSSSGPSSAFLPTSVLSPIDVLLNDETRIFGFAHPDLDLRNLVSLSPHGPQHTAHTVLAEPFGTTTALMPSQNSLNNFGGFSGASRNKTDAMLQDLRMTTAVLHDMSNFGGARDPNFVPIQLKCTTEPGTSVFKIHESTISVAYESDTAYRTKTSCILETSCYKTVSAVTTVYSYGTPIMVYKQIIDSEQDQLELLRLGMSPRKSARLRARRRIDSLMDNIAGTRNTSWYFTLNHDCLDEFLRTFISDFMHMQDDDHKKMVLQSLYIDTVLYESTAEEKANLDHVQQLEFFEPITAEIMSIKLSLEAVQLIPVDFDAYLAVSPMKIKTVAR